MCPGTYELGDLETAKNSMWMGRTVLLATIVVIVIVFVPSQEMWSISHTQAVYSDGHTTQTTTITMTLHSDFCLFCQSGGSAPIYMSYADQPTRQPGAFFNLEEGLRLAWIGAVLLFICAIFANLRLLSLIIGLAGSIIGISSIVAFVEGIGSALTSSQLFYYLGVSKVDFWGSSSYEVPLGGGYTEVHELVMGPSIGFWLLVAALFLQYAVITVRTFAMMRESKISRLAGLVDSADADESAGQQANL